MKIVIYSTHSCPYCILVKNFLKEHKISFEEIYVDDDAEKAREMMEGSGEISVPQIKIDNEIVVGFDKEKLKKLLKIK